ncbi:MAG: hypothetical protein J0L93_07190 [Deltaproteobacteria bacterium]|nr:hypothetical protein [Deltaproteobacteria bacterium]
MNLKTLFLLTLILFNQIENAFSSEDSPSVIADQVMNEIAARSKKIEERIQSNPTNISGAEKEESFYYDKVWIRRIPTVLLGSAVSTGLGIATVKMSFLNGANYAESFLWFVGGTSLTLISTLFPISYLVMGGKKDALERKYVEEFLLEAKTIQEKAQQLSKDLASLKEANAKGFYSTEDNIQLEKIAADALALEAELQTKYSEKDKLASDRLKTPFSDHLQAKLGTIFHADNVNLFELQLQALRAVQEKMALPEKDSWHQKEIGTLCKRILARFPKI